MSAEAHATADDPVGTHWIDVDTADGPMGAYLAVPPAGRGPGLLLLQEIFGVNPHIRGVARQYALAGFTVIAPDLFWRQAPRVELDYVGNDRDRAMTLMRTITREAVVGDLQATLQVLRARPEWSGRVGAIGYCMGGRLAYTAAALCNVDAAVCYYGGGIAGQLDLASRIRCPVQFHHAGQDTSIPVDAVTAIRDAMAKAPAASACEFHFYPQAQHGFNCWARSAYLPADAALAHGRSLTFLSQLF